MTIGAGSTASEVRDRIASVYAAGPWTLGWSYIYGQPESRRAPRIVTIGLNPGGGRDGRDHQTGDLDQGRSPDIVNAYFDQPWGDGGTPTALQRQMAHLRDLNPGVPPADWLSFQFVPFRSPGWADLPCKDDAIALGRELLPWTLATARPELVVGFGLAPVARELLSFLEAERIETCDTGWGKTQAEVYRAATGGRIVLLPHLSRYQVLGRAAFVDAERLLRVA